jgi:TRAP-type C4-dicarboxylate transport system substrate-binding protein
MMRLKALTLAVSAAVALMAGSAMAQEDWKLGSAKRAPDIGATFDQEFAADFVKATNDKGKIEIQFIGNEQEMVQQVIRGRIQFGVTSPLGMAAAIPDMSVFTIPYLWTTRAERDYVYRNHLIEPLKAMMAAKGMVLLAIEDAGYNGVFCKMDCSNPAALKGQKARVSPSAASKMFYESLGAIPVQLPLADVWTALEQNLVVAGDLPLGFFSTTPGAATAQHFVYTNHTHSPWMYFVNKGLWDGLSEDQQKAVLAAMPEAYSKTDRFNDALGDRAKDYASKGGTVYDLTDEQRAGWAALITPNIPNFVTTLSPEAQALYEIIKKGKDEFAAKKS